MKQRGDAPDAKASDESNSAASRYELTKPRFEIRADLGGEGSASLRDGEMGMVLARATEADSLAELGLRGLQRQFDRIVEQHMGQ